MKPTFAGAHYNLALVLQIKKNNLQAAIVHYYKAIEIDPEFSTNAYNNLAFALNSAGRTNEAICELLTVLGIQPDHSGAKKLLTELAKKSTN